MSSKRTWAFRLLGAGAVMPFVVSSCAETKTPGQLVLVVQTDMDIPKDIDAIEVVVASQGAHLHEGRYEIGRDPESGKIALPATLPIVHPGDDKPSAPVTVSVVARRGGVSGAPLALRRATTTVPADRIAALPLPIKWLCYDLASGPGACEEGHSCVAGECKADVERPSIELPEFAPGQVFGGGTGSGDGRCFDVEACFEASANDITPDADCSFERPPSPLDVNFAVVTGPASANAPGFCGDENCFVPLDYQGEGGWFERDDGRVQLPESLCSRMGQSPGRFRLVASSACPLKTMSLPPCGEFFLAGGEGRVRPEGPGAGGAGGQGAGGGTAGAGGAMGASGQGGASGQAGTAGRGGEGGAAGEGGMAGEAGAAGASGGAGTAGAAGAGGVGGVGGQGGGQAPGSCKGKGDMTFCGKQSPDGCWCDIFCGLPGYADCCPDKADLCGLHPAPPLERFDGARHALVKGRGRPVELVAGPGGRGVHVFEQEL